VWVSLNYVAPQEFSRPGVASPQPPAQIALAWLLAQRPFIVPIPGTRNIDHLTENLGAIDVELTPADVQQISTESAALTVYGERMDATTWHWSSDAAAALFIALATTDPRRSEAIVAALCPDALLLDLTRASASPKDSSGSSLTAESTERPYNPDV
jgi:hypothetical protein